MTCERCGGGLCTVSEHDYSEGYHGWVAWCQGCGGSHEIADAKEGKGRGQGWFPTEQAAADDWNTCAMNHRDLMKTVIEQGKKEQG